MKSQKGSAGRSDKAQPKEKRDPERDLLSPTMVDHGKKLAEEADAKGVFICTEIPGLNSKKMKVGFRNRKILQISRTRHHEDELPPGVDHVIPVPDVDLNRMDQIKIGIMMAISNGHLKMGERIVSLAGLPGTKTLDCMVVTEIGKEFELLFPPTSKKQLA